MARVALGLALVSLVGCGAIRAPSPRAVRLSLSCAVAAHVHDTVSTVVAVRAGAGYEANPVYAPLAQSTPLLIAAKMGPALWVNHVVHTKAGPRVALWMGAIQCVGVHAIAVQNWRVFQQGQ